MARSPIKKGLLAYGSAVCILDKAKTMSEKVTAFIKWVWRCPRCAANNIGTHKWVKRTKCYNCSLEVDVDNDTLEEKKQ